MGRMPSLAFRGPALDFGARREPYGPGDLCQGSPEKEGAQNQISQVNEG
jgi:hypothetical protein